MTTAPTLDLLDAIRDVTTWRDRAQYDQPLGGILLHGSGEYLAVTAAHALDGEIIAAATATIAIDGELDDGFILTADAVRHLEALRAHARRPEGQPIHEVTLTITGRQLRVEEAGGLFQATADVTLHSPGDPVEYPESAVDAILTQQFQEGAPLLGTDETVPALYMALAAQVAKRRGAPSVTHSIHHSRALITVGRDWTCSVPTITPLPPRPRIIPIIPTELQKAA